MAKRKEHKEANRKKTQRNKNPFKETKKHTQKSERESMRGKRRKNNALKTASWTGRSPEEALVFLEDDKNSRRWGAMEMRLKPRRRD